MLEKEIAELRRRFRYEKNAIDVLCGCYVNEQKEIVTTFRQSMPAMGQEEAEKYLALFRRSLSGGVGKNLLDIAFTNEQVTNGEEHRLLTALRSSGLTDGEAVERIFSNIIGSLQLEGNYLILLAHDVYDVPSYGKDGEQVEDGSETMFSYIICCICPVKLTKPSLRYDSFRSLFQSQDADQVVASPELGFLFPAFDDRCANLYGALYSTRNLTDSHQELVDVLFGTSLPMPADTQKELFSGMLSDSLEEACSYEVVQTVHDALLARVEEQKEHREEPVAPVTKAELSRVLESCGIAEEKIAGFEQHYNESFGGETALCPQNLVGSGELELRTEDVTIRIDAAHSDLVETCLLDGKPSIIIRAEGTLTVNGIPITIKQEKERI